jgi:hypothetical protein
MIINEFKLLAFSLELDIFYSDTDSLVVNGPLPPEVCDSAKLGQLKLEHTFREGIFAAPKIYYLELDDGTTVTKCKGYGPVRRTYAATGSGKLSKAQYLDLLEGNSLDLTVTKWVRSLKDSSIQIKRNTPYAINFSFNKRQQLLEKGVWVNTRPLIIE